jgi:septum formation topological specificity factor MinE
MVRGRAWTGFEAVALQEAMRRSVRDFAALLGLETTTVNNWRAGLGSVRPRSSTQAILDTTFDLKATPQDRARFDQIVAEGEVAWRKRQRSQRRSGRSTAAAVGIETISTAHAENSAVTESPLLGARAGEELHAVLARVDDLSRSINPEILEQLQSSTLQCIARYETIDPSELVPALQEQRVWLAKLIDECGHPRQRGKLFEIASETSGLLGYIAVGCGNFPLARAYSLESFHLGEYAQDNDLVAWARGMQSFCEYYSGQYDKALRYAQDGLTHAGVGPQSVRLSINGIARAMGRIGDVEGVHRAVDQAYEHLSRNTVPEGVPSSISLASYSPAQVAGNAATAYLSLAMPGKVEQYVQLALPEMTGTNSPWGRSLVLIDLARSHVLSEDADLDSAVAIMLDALKVAAGKPMIQVLRRGSEFVRDAGVRWGETAQLRVVREALASWAGLG